MMGESIPLGWVTLQWGLGVLRTPGNALLVPLALVNAARIDSSLERRLRGLHHWW